MVADTTISPILKTQTPFAIEMHQSWKEVIPFALIFLAACWVLFFQLGKFPLFNPDEALYAEPAREMLLDGDWITTHLNYVVRYTKPPLCIWAMAGCFQIFGVTEFAARFFGAGCGAVLVALTYWFSRRFVSLRAAVIASLTLCTAPLFVAVSRQAITDMPLALFTAGAIMCLYTAKETGSARWRWLGYILIGLAVMTKGPVGLILPVVPLAGFYLQRGEFKEAWHSLRPISGLALVALIALPWFIAEIAITKGAYFTQFIIHENFQRYTSVVDKHEAPVWYHVVAMFGGFLPWSLFLPLSFFALVLALRAHGYRMKELDDSSKLSLMCWQWALFILFFFSLSVSKLLPYTMPAFPALAILAGQNIDRAIAGQKRIQILIPLILIGIAYGVTMQVGPGIVEKLKSDPVALKQALVGFAAFESVLAAVCCLLAALNRLSVAVVGFAALTLVAMTHFGPRALLSLSEEWEAPIVAFSRYVAASKDPIVVFSMRKPSVTFYAQRQVIITSHPVELVQQLQSLPRAYVLGWENTWPDPSIVPGCRVVDHRGPFWLVQWINPDKPQPAPPLRTDQSGSGLDPVVPAAN